MKILKENQLDNIIRSLNFIDAEADKVEDQILSRFLKYVHVLGTSQENIKNVIGSLNIEDLFYSKYYWFKQFKERYFKLYGHDEGLEQQSYKMIEEYTHFTKEIDWETVEQIENNSYFD
jgi:hypothetical protein